MPRTVFVQSVKGWCSQDARGVPVAADRSSEPQTIGAIPRVVTNRIARPKAQTRVIGWNLTTKDSAARDPAHTSLTSPSNRTRTHT